MSKIIDFAGEAKKFMAQLPMQPIDIDPDLKHISAENGTIDLELFKTDKIEKIVFCSINMHETGVKESTAMIWPDNNYYLPVLWCNLTIVPEVMNVPVFDFIPMMDYVVWPEYAEKYVACISDLRDDAIEIFGETLTDKAVNLPSLSVYTLSPYKFTAMITEAGIEKSPLALENYIKKYIELWQQAEALKENKDKAFYLKKKAATSKLMKANDPGYPFMVDVFGEKITHKVFDLVF